MNATGRVGAFVARCEHGTLPDAVRENAAVCFLDALGLAVAARNEQTAVAARAAATNAVSVEKAARIWADRAWVALTIAFTLRKMS
jgi:2-methylcitrate dehydratase PrpD